MKNIKIQLIVLFFLQFAILGSFIISLGGYLASQGLGKYIGEFYAIGGFVNLILPALFGIIADRYIPAQRLYGGIHFLLALSLLFFALYVKTGVSVSDVPVMIVIFTVISSLYYPTISLGFSVAFISLRSNGMDVKNVLPLVRMFGTIGFIVAMVMTDLLGVQFSYGQFLIGTSFALLLSAWSFILPNCPPRQTKSFGGVFSGFALLKEKRMAVFFFFVLCVGISLKLSEAYVNPFFAAMHIEHPNMLISISRISEALCILLVPFSFKYLGMRKTIMVAILSWGLHFGSMAYGCSYGLLWPLIVAMVVYGIGFDFFNIAGMIYLDSLVSPETRSTAQGLFATFTNGFGFIFGSFIGQSLFNMFVYSSEIPDWSLPWTAIAVGCTVVLCIFVILRKFISE